MTSTGISTKSSSPSSSPSSALIVELDDTPCLDSIVEYLSSVPNLVHACQNDKCEATDLCVALYDPLYPDRCNRADVIFVHPQPFKKRIDDAAKWSLPKHSADAIHTFLNSEKLFELSVADREAAIEYIQIFYSDIDGDAFIIRALKDLHSEMYIPFDLSKFQYPVVKLRISINEVAETQFTLVSMSTVVQDTMRTFHGTIFERIADTDDKLSAIVHGIYKKFMCRSI